MTNKVKIMLAGLLVGGAVIFVATSTTSRYAKLVRELVAVCEQQDLRLGSRWQPVCDERDLVRLGGSGGGGIEDQIIAAEMTRQEWQHRSDWLIPFGMMIIIATGLPWTWLFLLNRVRELSNAVAGRS